MSNSEKIKRFIFTGTSGSGKSSVIKKILGYSIIHESATDIITAEQAKGIRQPWENRDFIDKIVFKQKERQMKAIGKLQFYDRSPFCTYALGKYLAKGKKIEFMPEGLD